MYTWSKIYIKQRYILHVYILNIQCICGQREVGDLYRRKFIENDQNRTT